MKKPKNNEIAWTAYFAGVISGALLLWGYANYSCGNTEAGVLSAGSALFIFLFLKWITLKP